MYETKDNFKGFPMAMMLAQSYTRRVAPPYGFPYSAPDEKVCPLRNLPTAFQHYYKRLFIGSSVRRSARGAFVITRNLGLCLNNRRRFLSSPFYRCLSLIEEASSDANLFLSISLADFFSFLFFSFFSIFLFYSFFTFFFFLFPLLFLFLMI